MKKTLLLFCVSIFSGAATYAQTKIKDGSITSSTLPNVNAILELESANKGFLLPRVALDQTLLPSPLTAHIAGMMVYNTATANDVTPGYYYNDGNQWVKATGSTVAGAEPWNVQGSNTSASNNTENIYQTQ